MSVLNHLIRRTSGAIIGATMACHGLLDGLDKDFGNLEGRIDDGC